jgi:hypothetical protein
MLSTAVVNNASLNNPQSKYMGVHILPFPDKGWIRYCCRHDKNAKPRVEFDGRSNLHT